MHAALCARQCASRQASLQYATAAQPPQRWAASAAAGMSAQQPGKAQRGSTWRGGLTAGAGSAEGAAAGAAGGRGAAAAAARAAAHGPLCAGQARFWHAALQ